MKKKQKNFARFMRTERAAAAVAYASGDASLVRQLSTTRDPATFLGPGGGIVTGAGRVNATNERGTKRFASGGSSGFKVMQQSAADRLAFWTGFQIARVRLPGKPGLVPMKLRVTEVFRWETQGWKLIHRHADMLATPAKGK